jgi:hypothetical protein
VPAQEISGDGSGLGLGFLVAELQVLHGQQLGEAVSDVVWEDMERRWTMIAAEKGEAAPGFWKHPCGDGDGKAVGDWAAWQI